MNAFLDFNDPEFSTRSNAVLAARDAGWCAKTPYGLAVLRHREAGQLLRDRRLRQGSYSWPRKHGLEGAFTDFWEASVISRSGRDHQQLRQLIVPVLTDAFVSSLVPQFEEIADDLCSELKSGESCEFMEQFAIPFAGQAIAVLLGLGRDKWRQISHDASDLGLAMGVNCKSHEALINAACSRLMELAAVLIERARSGKDQSGLVAQVLGQFEQEEGLVEQDLLNMIVIAIFGGVDTTRSQLGLGLSLLIDAPDQWRLLSDNPEFVPNAVEEIIRARPTTTWVTREATEDFEFSGTFIAQGTTVHVLVHATGTDGVVVDTPSFDVTTRKRSHFGFGGGAHHCIGHLIARTDIACALRGLLKTFETLDYDGQASWLPDSGNTSPVTLPIRYNCL